MSAKLSIVATPIGNLEDITLRALRTLKEAEWIACEDTRITRKLLAHFDIHTKVVSFHSNSGAKGFNKIIALLEESRRVALVCDAGTPGISDPGLELVSVVREKLPEVTIETIPGASSLTAALAIAGLRAASFIFWGFLPPKKGREKLLREIVQETRASIFFESPHRIVKALQVLTPLVQSGRRIGIFRELTKVYEEVIIGSPAEVLQVLVDNPQKQRGEFVVLLESCPKR